MFKQLYRSSWRGTLKTKVFIIRRMKMNRLKRIIAIALLVSILPRTVMAEDGGTKGDTDVSKN